MILRQAVFSPARLSVHCQDEPARLSLGMIASQQSPLPFHPAIDSTSVWMFGNNSLPSYGLTVLEMPLMACSSLRTTAISA